MSLTRVAVLAASPVVRAGLEALLGDRNGLVVVGTESVPTGADGVERVFDRVADWDADVVLWVIDPPDREPIEPLLRRAGVTPAELADASPFPPESAEREAGSAPAVVLLAGPGTTAAWTAVALRAGVRAVLPGDVAAATLALVVEAAAAGLTVMPAELAAAVLAAPVAGERTLGAGVARGQSGGRAPGLSGREREVLALLAEGLPNKVIAPRLGISEHTVKAHVAAIFEKLGSGTRAEAVVTAARLGVLLL